MICSNLNNDKYLFLQLHAEQAYTNVELYKRNSLMFSNSLSNVVNSEQTQEDKEEKEIKNIEYGVFGQRLTITTINKLFNFIKDANLQPNYIVFDFNRLVSVQKNIFQLFHKTIELIVDQNKTLLLINISENIFELLKLDSLIDHQKILSKKEAYLYSKNNEIKESDFDDLTESVINELFERTLLEETGLNLSEEEPELNPSSSVYINKYVNVKNLLNKDKFFAYCIYKLALQMIRPNGRDWSIMNDFESEKEKISLFFQTLNGAFIASSLCDLLHVDTCFVDHIGPINKLYNIYFGKRITRGKRYIVVADVVCLGTEVKIAKSLIEHSGGHYLGNVSIIRSKTLKEKDRKFTDVASLFEINIETNAKYNLNYKIMADLS